ncbi:MAG: hypothetical protein DMF27_06920 [Verrucomicrobia bacterium]|nr:MAG: hypothetical protein DMF27_06920 [Verrucomicrobiota bacterium]
MRFFKNIIDKFAGKPVDWDELEEALIRSDIGVPMTLRILKTLREREAWSWVTANDIAAGASESHFDCRRQRNRQNNLHREAGTFFQNKAPQGLVGRSRYFSGGSNRTIRDLGRTNRR